VFNSSNVIKKEHICFT